MVGATAPVRRVAVFRALMLGDLLCAVPALRAMRAGWPGAALTLIGLPWAAELARRLDCIDDFIAFPGHPAWPEARCDGAAWPAFLATVQARRYDLAVQLHGSGTHSNPLVALFGARRSAGFCTQGAWRPAADARRYLAWPERGHEVERLLALTDRLGLPRRGTQLEFPVHEADRHALHAAWPGIGAAGPYAVVHAGAQLASRRWSLDGFAAVGESLVARGRTVVLTGTAGEAERVARLAARLPAAVDLCGRTDLGMLGALVERASLVVCNDTGVSHLAAALARPSVVISCGADAARWAAQDTTLHRTLAADLPCRPCGHADCPIGHPCASAITPADVLHAVRALETPPGAPA
jgi:ADP-heptose:LPS heptosyltransferase